jgi:hypothetical protein
MPEARVAILRVVVYLFAVIDVLVFVDDVIPKAQLGAAYSPLALARELHLPGPSPALAYTLQAVIVVGCIVAATGRLPRAVGYPVAGAFAWWVLLGMSYGKVDHDHLALVVALWVLPTVGSIPGRWRSARRSAQAGWALKCIQIGVVFTYFLSALTKIRSGDWSITSWPDSAILTWAIIRRPHGLGQFLLPYPGVLHVMQWMSFTAELTSLVVLWLRGRALLAAALFWIGFHVFTVVILYIHFAPTLICWLAFAPLERFAPWLRRVETRRRQRTGRRAARHPISVLRDQSVDGSG